jgi:hypothetical protein
LPMGFQIDQQHAIAVLPGGRRSHQRRGRAASLPAAGPPGATGAAACQDWGAHRRRPPSARRLRPPPPRRSERARPSHRRSAAHTGVGQGRSPRRTSPGSRSGSHSGSAGPSPGGARRARARGDPVAGGYSGRGRDRSANHSRDTGRAPRRSAFPRERWGHRDGPEKC